MKKTKRRFVKTHSLRTGIKALHKTGAESPMYIAVSKRILQGSHKGRLAVDKHLVSSAENAETLKALIIKNGIGSTEFAIEKVNLVGGTNAKERK